MPILPCLPFEPHAMPMCCLYKIVYLPLPYSALCTYISVACGPYLQHNPILFLYLLVGRWVDEEAHRGLSACKRVYCIGVVQYSAPILRRRRGGADVGVVIRAGWLYVKTCWSCF